MIAFTMMAVGLNIVVGYCGLLDLGYVAFYAVGAYTAGWLASQHFSGVTLHFGSSVDNDLVGIHMTMWIVLIVAGLLTMLAGIIIGLPTLRLRGDYLAIVTLGFGEIIPQVVRNGDSFGGFNLTNGTFGIAPDRPGGLPAPQRPRAARQLPDLGQPRALVLPRRAPAPAPHDLLLRPAAGLAARAGVDRDPRGRDGGGRDGRAPDADEDVGVRARRVLRRRRGRVLRELQVGRLPGGLLLQHLRVPAVHGDPGRHGQHLGRGRRRDDPRVPELQRALDDRLEDPGRGARLRPDEVPVRDLRDHHRPDDAVPPRGPHPRAPAQDRARGGRARHAVLRRPDSRARSPTAIGPTTDGRRRPRRGHAAPQGVRRPRGDRRRRLHDPARLDRRADRAERRGQDDVLQPAHGRLQADVGLDRVRRDRGLRAAAARDHRARRRADVPEHPALRRR